MSYEQYLKDIDDIKTMKRDRKTVVKHFIEKMKMKAGLTNGNEKGGESFRHSFQDSSESEKRLEETI